MYKEKKITKVEEVLVVIMAAVFTITFLSIMIYTWETVVSGYF